jgi:hypothetical protein
LSLADKARAALVLHAAVRKGIGGGFGFFEGAHGVQIG